MPAADPADADLEIPVTLLDPDLPLPSYAHPGDAGADLVTTVDVALAPGERVLVPTGVAIALPDGYVALVHPRSGLAARHGLSIVNTPGHHRRRLPRRDQGAADQPRPWPSRSCCAVVTGSRSWSSSGSSGPGSSPLPTFPKVCEGAAATVLLEASAQWTSRESVREGEQPVRFRRKSDADDPETGSAAAEDSDPVRRSSRPGGSVRRRRPPRRRGAADRPRCAARRARRGTRPPGPGRREVRHGPVGRARRQGRRRRAARLRRAAQRRPLERDPTADRCRRRPARRHRDRARRAVRHRAVLRGAGPEQRRQGRQPGVAGDRLQRAALAAARDLPRPSGPRRRRARRVVQLPSPRSPYDAATRRCRWGSSCRSPCPWRSSA